MANQLAPPRSTASVPAKSAITTESRFAALRLSTTPTSPGLQEGQERQEDGTQECQNKTASLDPKVVIVQLPIRDAYIPLESPPPYPFKQSEEYRNQFINGVIQVHDLAGKIIETILFPEEVPEKVFYEGLKSKYPKLSPGLLARIRDETHTMTRAIVGEAGYFHPETSDRLANFFDFITGSRRYLGPTALLGLPSPRGRTDALSIFRDRFAEMAGRHEAYHGVFDRIGKKGPSAFSVLFERFKKDPTGESRYFSPLAEGKFFLLFSRAGHPQDSPSEFFASLMNSTHHPNLQVKLASVKDRFLKNYAISLNTALNLVRNSEFSESKLPQHIQRALTLVDAEIKRRAAPATSASRPSPSPND